MADYSAISARAARKIADKGMPMVLVARDEGAYDPATNTRPTVETRTDIMGVRTSPGMDEVQSGLFAVGSTIRHGNGRREVIVQLCHGVDLRQQLRLVLADGILSLCNLVPAFLQRQVVIHCHLQALAQRQSFLRHHSRKSPESQTKTQYLFLVHY